MCGVVMFRASDISITVGYDGRPTRKFGLSWSEMPTAVGYCFPYVLALLPKFLEVRTMFGTQTLGTPPPHHHPSPLARPSPTNRNRNQPFSAVRLRGGLQCKRCRCAGPS